MILNSDSKLVKERRAICNSCDYKKEDMVFGDRCGKCKCIIKYKTRVKNSKCPINEW